MSKLRRDVSNEQVLKLLQKYNNNITHVSLALGVSRALVRSVKNGKRKETVKVKRRINKEDLCTCCGLRPIDRKNGLRFLCRTCFKNPPADFYA